MVQKNLQVVLKESEPEIYAVAESEQVSDEEGSHPAEERVP